MNRRYRTACLVLAFAAMFTASLQSQSSSSSDLNNQLLRAVVKRESLKVSELLRRGADVNAEHPLTGWSGLGIAAFYGWPEIVNTLIRSGAHVNHVDEHRRTPLMKAVTLGPYESKEEVLARKAMIVRALLQAGADPYASDAYGQPVWEMPKVDKHREIQSIFEDAGIRESGETLLISAIARKETKEIRRLTSGRVNLNFVDAYGWNALRAAVIRGDVQTVRLLVESGADVQTRLAGGWTVLMIAADENQMEVARLLVRAKADPDIRNNRGDSARSIAARRGHQEILALFGSPD